MRTDHMSFAYSCLLHVVVIGMAPSHLFLFKLLLSPQVYMSILENRLEVHIVPCLSLLKKGEQIRSLPLKQEEMIG